MEAAGPLGRAELPNKELDALETQLEPLQRAGSADAFCSYLYGIILIDRYALQSGTLIDVPGCGSLLYKRCIGYGDLSCWYCRERKVEARSVLLASVWAYPCNWSAWKVGLCSRSPPLAVLPCSSHSRERNAT